MEGSSPEEVFTNFRDHLNDLLHHTVTQAPLVQVIVGERAFVEFRQGENSIAVPVGGGYYLFLAQTLEAQKLKAKQFRLRTLAYAYRIGRGPKREDDWCFRWEYDSPDQLPDALQPRNHCHLPTSIQVGRKNLNLEKLHIASGWVTIEAIIRFLIHELKVKPKRADWDARLHASEEKFREWTGRTI